MGPRTEADAVVLTFKSRMIDNALMRTASDLCRLLGRAGQVPDRSAAEPSPDTRLRQIRGQCHFNKNVWLRCSCDASHE